MHGASGGPVDFSLFAEALAIEITCIVILVLITDIKMYTWFSTFMVIGVVTVLGSAAFFLLENFFPFFRNCYVLNNSSFHFWQTVFLCVVAVYAAKIFIDTVKRENYETQVEKALRAKYYEEKASY